MGPLYGKLKQDVPEEAPPTWGSGLPQIALVVGFLRGGVFKWGGNWGTLRIPFGKIGEP